MDEESKKIIEGLSDSVKAMQAEILTLKSARDTRESEVTNSGSNSLAGSQNSDLVPSSGPPPNKRRKTVSEGASDDEDEEEDEEFVDLRCNTGDLVQMSEEASAFIETSFNAKMKNSDRTSQAGKFGVPDSRWLKCPELDPVVSSTIPAAARRTDRAASRLQNYWLDAVNPLVYVLEKAEELNLPAEAVNSIQTSLRLLGNANAHNTTARGKSLLMQMNPHLKDLLRDKDFKEAAPMLFGENFGSLAKDRLEAAAALTKTLSIDKPRSDFHKGHSQRGKGRGGGAHYSGHYKQRGWQPSNSKTAQRQSKK